MMRAKLVVADLLSHGTCDQLTFRAVYRSDAYPADGSDENNTFARFTPTADLKMVITNPDLVGKIAVGDVFYVDFTKVPNA